MAKEIIVSAGCLWCVEHFFQQIKGVESAIPGYTPNENLPKPKTFSDMLTYVQNDDYRESVKITYSNISLDELISLYLSIIDPYDLEGSFNNRGFKYTPMISVSSDLEKETIQEIFDRQDIKIPILCQIPFYELMEQYHNFAKKNPEEYHAFLQKINRKKPSI